MQIHFINYCHSQQNLLHFSKIVYTYQSKFLKTLKKVEHQLLKAVLLQETAKKVLDKKLVCGIGDP